MTASSVCLVRTKLCDRFANISPPMCAYQHVGAEMDGPAPAW